MAFAILFGSVLLFFSLIVLAHYVVALLDQTMFGPRAAAMHAGKWLHERKHARDLKKFYGKMAYPHVTELEADLHEDDQRVFEIFDAATNRFFAAIDDKAERLDDWLTANCTDAYEVRRKAIDLDDRNPLGLGRVKCVVRLAFASSADAVACKLRWA